MSAVLQNAMPGALEIARLVRTGGVSATQVVEDALARIAAGNPAINAFTEVLATRARTQAQGLDAARRRGEDPGPLAGVPFAVKNLFDIEGLVTLEGSKLAKEHPPAGSDAFLVRQLSAAGAVLVGALNMDEYAFGFSTQNTHYGPTRNPHALERIAGGSSGGSAAAVAAGLVPLTLGSDTNGSIRVPSALCGIFGLKPTYGRLGRGGAKLFAASFDHVGPMARNVADLAAAYDALQGLDASDPVAQRRPLEPVAHTLNAGVQGLRIAVAGGHFATLGQPEVFAALARVAEAFGVTRTVELPQAGTARSAAMLITAAEGAELHLADLRQRSGEFDPHTRYMFLAGAMLPAAWYVRAQRFRSWYCQQLAKLFEEVDVILAPATPYPAFPIGTPTVQFGELTLPAAVTWGCTPSRCRLPACRWWRRRWCRAARCRWACRSLPRRGAKTWRLPSPGPARPGAFLVPTPCPPLEPAFELQLGTHHG